MSRYTRRALLGAAAASAAAATRFPEKIRLALIGGLGHVGEFLSPLDALPDVDVVGWWEPNAQDAARFKKNPRTASAPAYTDWREMLDKAKPHVAGICTPNAGRVEPILACAERRIHFLAEKPYAVRLDEFAKLRKAVEASGVKAGILLPMRFDSPYLALKRIVDSGAIGEVGQISAQKSYKAGNRPQWMKQRATYGGTIEWIGIHMIDLMRFTSGREMTQVYSWQAQVGAPPGIGEMENTTASVFRLDNGGTATLHMDYYRPESAPTHGDDRLRLAGTKGVAEYLEATGVTLLSEGNKPRKVEPLPPERSLFVDFLEHVYLGKPAGVSWNDIVRANVVTLAAAESARTGRVVRTPA